MFINSQMLCGLLGIQCFPQCQFFLLETLYCRILLQLLLYDAIVELLQFIELILLKEGTLLCANLLASLLRQTSTIFGL